MFIKKISLTNGVPTDLNATVTSGILASLGQPYDGLDLRGAHLTRTHHQLPTCAGLRSKIVIDMYVGISQRCVAYPIRFLLPFFLLYTKDFQHDG
jgi:hypothetical protein